MQINFKEHLDKSDGLGEKIRYFTNFFRPVLESKKSLYHEGISKLSSEDLSFLSNDYEDHEFSDPVVIFLVMFIQAFPKNEISFKDDAEITKFVSCLKTLIHFAQLEKHNLVEIEYFDKKLNYKKPFKYKLKQNDIFNIF